LTQNLRQLADQNWYLKRNISTRKKFTLEVKKVQLKRNMLSMMNSDFWLN